MANISQNVNIEMLEKLPDGTYKRKYPKTRADDGTTFDEHLAEKATETQEGHIQLATASEVSEGTEGTKAVTSLRLKTELDKKINSSEKGQPNGVAELNGDGLVSEDNLPPLEGVWEKITKVTLSEPASQINFENLSDFERIKIYFSALNTNASRSSDIKINFNEDIDNEYSYTIIPTNTSNSEADNVVLSNAITRGSDPITIGFIEIQCNNNDSPKQIMANYPTDHRRSFVTLVGGWSKSNEIVSEINLVAAGDDFSVDSFFELWGMK